MQPTLKKINYKNKLLTAICISLLVVISSLLFVFKSSFTAVLDMSSNISRQYTELDSKFRESKNIKQILRELGDSKEKSADFNEFFLRPGQELMLITKLEEIASQNNLEQSINLNPVSTKKQGVIKSPLSLSISGGYENLIAYFEDLQSLAVYLNIYSMNISRTGAADGEIAVQASINADINYIIQK